MCVCVKKVYTCIRKYKWNIFNMFLEILFIPKAALLNTISILSLISMVFFFSPSCNIFRWAPSVGDEAFVNEYTTFVPRISFWATNKPFFFLNPYSFFKLKRTLFLLHITMHCFKTNYISCSIQVCFPNTCLHFLTNPFPPSTPRWCCIKIAGVSWGEKKQLLTQKSGVQLYI